MTRHLYALLVGINKYDRRSRISRLRGCVNDVHSMRDYLDGRVATGEFDLHLQVLTNEQATYDNIVDGFRTHLSQAKAEDVVLFYYAGHGAQASAPQEFWPIEPDRQLETLVCYDSRIDDNHWDLADKELAKLIADVSGPPQQKGPHVAVILDCCHSGSGTRSVEDPEVLTRRAEPDYRQRPLSTFLVSLDEAKRIGDESGGTRSLTPTALKLPVGRHVVLSACRDIEEAKEYMGGDRPHGAFSYFLQDSLAKANGPLSYRDLFKRTDALVRNNTYVQAPQLEATHPEDLEQLFLGGAIAPSLPYFTVSYDPEHHWVIDGGAIHGLQSPPEGAKPEETTLLALFPFDATPEQMKEISGALGQVAITQVLPQLSKINSSNTDIFSDTSNTYKAVVVGMPLPAVAIFLDGDVAGIKAAREAIATASPEGKHSLYVKGSDRPEGASYRLLAKDNRYLITPPGENRPLVTVIEGYEASSAKEAVKKLEHIARWKTIAELDSPANSQIQGAIKLSIYTGEGDDLAAATEITDPQIRLSYTFNPASQKWEKPKFRIKLRNTSNQPLHCALLYLTESFKVQPLSPSGVGNTVTLNPDEETWYAGGRVLSGSVADQLWQKGVTECRDLLKLIACRDAFDPTLMKLGELGTPIARDTTRSLGTHGTLNKLMERVTTREMSFDDEEPSYDDWVATHIAFTFVRPQETTSISRSAPVNIGQGIGTQVNIQPHPALTAKARLTTVAQSTRDLGSFVMPTLLKPTANSEIESAAESTEAGTEQENYTEPFQFTQSRSSDPGLSALELSDVEDFEAVTASSPLVIETAMPLGEDEYVLPIAYDGEFYLPLGYGKPTGNNQTKIVLNRLTAPLSVGSRSIQGSIKIFFQKIITKKLGKKISDKVGISFDYPLLASAKIESESSASSESAVAVVTSQVTYNRDAEAVKAAVSTANNIALYVHGIFGDTESMLPSVDTAMMAIGDKSQPIGELYDLVLAFDYENLNTSIDQNARLLKERLAAVGLEAGHGKTLHIIAHSMGGLVSRWFIEQEGGNDIVDHLIMLGTPNAGSPWPQVQEGITAAVSFALNGLSLVAAPIKLLHGLLQRIESIDVSLDQMSPGSDFLAELAGASDPAIPYTLVVGDTSRIPKDETATLKQRITDRLWKAVELPFLNQPNDIAVLVESITAIPEGRSPAPKSLPTACNHLEYFVHPAGLASLSTAVVGTGITASTRGNGARTRAIDPTVSEPAARSTAESDSPSDGDSTPTAKEDPEGERTSSGVINLWVWAIVAIALFALGVVFWSQLTSPETEPEAVSTSAINP